MSKKQIVVYSIAAVIIVIGIYKFILPKQPNTLASKITGAPQLTKPGATDPNAAGDVSKNAVTDPSSNESLLKKYTDLITKNNEDADAYYQRGLVYQKMQQYTQAINDFTEVVRITPSSSNALFSRGLMHAFRTEYDDAIVDFTAAIKLKPTDPRMFNSRGLVYIEQAKYDEALKDYDQALVLDSKYGKAYFNRGTIFERQNKMREAKAEYDKAIEYNKAEDDDANADATKHRLLETYYRRAITLLNSSDLNGALSDANYVIDQDPKFAKAYKLRAAINTKLGNSAAASADESTSQTLGMEQLLK